jgi:DNA-binding FadR family transcriptional regulator
MVSQALHIRALLAPAYTRMAISNTAPDVEKFLQGIAEGSEDPGILANQDFQAQKLLSRLSGNAILALTLNNLEPLYIKAMCAYYQDFEARKQARVYFRMVYKAARAGEPDAAEAITRRVMQECIQLWENPDTTGE